MISVISGVGFSYKLVYLLIANWTGQKDAFFPRVVQVGTDFLFQEQTKPGAGSSGTIAGICSDIFVQVTS